MDEALLAKEEIFSAKETLQATLEQIRTQMHKQTEDLQREVGYSPILICA